MSIFAEEQFAIFHSDGFVYELGEGIDTHTYNCR